MWTSMKTVFSPWISVATVWYWYRIRLLARPPVLLEKYVLASLHVEREIKSDILTFVYLLILFHNTELNFNNLSND